MFGIGKLLEIGEELKTIIIIGGGASGMMAAISAARHGAEVILIEHKDRIGKKILSTGNGKCNYTNRTQGLRYYRGENPAFVLPVFSQFGLEETLALFKEIGIFPKERNGYFYPASEQAAAVLDVLRMEIRRLPITIVTDASLTAIQKNTKGFSVVTNGNTYQGNACIFACGGKAFPKSGSDGSAFPFIKKLGHRFVEMVPALVQLKAKQTFFKAISGVRADVLVTLTVDDVCVCKDRGEVQFTDIGISGIPTFQVSRYAAKALYQKKTVQAILDVVPYMTRDELYQELLLRFYNMQGNKTCEEAFIGFFSKKLIPLFLKENHIGLSDSARSISKHKLSLLTDYLKNFTIDIVDTKGFDAAQTSAGGVNTDELDADTLESRLVPGLYFAGEVIDIDGMCGGYNLQWAWSSGYVAGMHAACKDR